MEFNESFDYRKFYSEKDAHYWEKLESLVKENNLSLSTVLKNYMAFIARRDLPQTLAYYDLFKMVKDLPGSIAEVGVFLGNGLFTWTKFMETFFPGNRGKKVYGFDNFKGYNSEVSKCDLKAIEYIKNLVGDFTVDYELVSQLEALHNLDSLLPGVERVKIYNGELIDTIKQFKSDDIGVRLKLLVVDVNLYIPTKTALEELYPLLIKGGIIALRGYGVKPWEGESIAVDEFLAANNIQQVHSFDFSNYPAIYFRKI